MQLKLRTRVPGHFQEVMAQFDRQLFEQLVPAFPKVEIAEFSGSKKGDRVHIRFLSPFRADWISHITEDGHNDHQAWFVDEGVKLPPGLTFWRHRHLVQKVDEETSEIIDDITFRSWNGLFTVLAWPVLYAAFFPRKKLYRDYFSTAA